MTGPRSALRRVSRGCARRFGRPLARTGTVLLTVAAVAAWLAAYLVTAPLKDTAPEPVGRHLPPIDTAAGTRVVADPRLPYTCDIPGGFAVLPTPPGTVVLGPESWLPTTAAITLTWSSLDEDSDALDPEELGRLAGLDAAADRPLLDLGGEVRALWEPLGDSGALVHVFHGRTMVVVRADTSGLAGEVYDHGVFPEAVMRVVESMEF